jgi:hypothetical protein
MSVIESYGFLQYHKTSTPSYILNVVLLLSIRNQIIYIENIIQNYSQPNNAYRISRKHIENHMCDTHIYKHGHKINAETMNLIIYLTYTILLRISHLYAYITYSHYLHIYHS